MRATRILRGEGGGGADNPHPTPLLNNERDPQRRRSAKVVQLSFETETRRVEITARVNKLQGLPFSL